MRENSKITKMPKKVVFGGYSFLTIFSVALFVIFGPQNCQNHSIGQAQNRKKSWYFPLFVLFGARGCLRTRFSSILGPIWDGFLMFFGTFFRITWAKNTCDQSSNLSVVWRFGATFSHALGIKSALTRITHPQQPLSKGGGLAKRPQL